MADQGSRQRLGFICGVKQFNPFGDFEAIGRSVRVAVTTFVQRYLRREKSVSLCRV